MRNNHDYGRYQAPEFTGLFKMRNKRVVALAAAMTIDRLDPPVLIAAPTAARVVTLPAVEDGLTFWIFNNAGGAYSLTVANAAASTIGTVAQNKSAMFYSDGISWFALVGS